MIVKRYLLISWMITIILSTIAIAYYAIRLWIQLGYPGMWEAPLWVLSLAVYASVTSSIFLLYTWWKNARIRLAEKGLRYSSTLLAAPLFYLSLMAVSYMLVIAWRLSGDTVYLDLSRFIVVVFGILSVSVFAAGLLADILNALLKLQG